MNTPTEETTTDQRAFETLGQFLDEDGWSPQQMEERTIYRVGFSGENAQFPCYAQVLVDKEQLLFYAMAPVKAPEEARPAVAEFVTRANYGMRIGNFEMDFSDGEVRYKSSLDFEGVALTPELMRNALTPAVQMMACYLPGLASVLGGRPPVEALAQAGVPTSEEMERIPERLREQELETLRAENRRRIAAAFQELFETIGTAVGEAGQELQERMAELEDRLPPEDLQAD